MITGTVMDQTGMPLKGVRIAARSATQTGGEKIAYTSAEGFFRVPGLQPGIFEIAATSPGLKSVIQKQIHVGVNAAAEVIIMMEVRSAEEEVKIVEKAPVVSTTSAKVKESFDSEFIDNLPLDKRTGYGGFIRDNVPGAAEGGPNPAIGDWTVRVRGGNDQQNAFMAGRGCGSGIETSAHLSRLRERSAAVFGRRVRALCRERRPSPSSATG